MKKSEASYTVGGKLKWCLNLEDYPPFPMKLNTELTNDPKISLTCICQRELKAYILKKLGQEWSSVQFSSVAQLCPTLCNPMDCSTPGFPVYHQLLESTQTHVHHIGDAIQPAHPLSSPFPPAFNLSQHKGLFK